MDTVALIRRIVRVTNKLSSSCAVLRKEELLKFVSQGLGGNDKGVTIRTHAVFKYVPKYTYVRYK